MSQNYITSIEEPTFLIIPPSFLMNVVLIKFFSNATPEKFNTKQVSIVRNNPRVIRGMHGDWSTSKIVTVVSGTITQVLLDCRKGSSTYSLAESFTVSQDSKVSLFIPPGVANGFQVHQEEVLYMYVQNTQYVPGTQFTVTPYDKVLKNHFSITTDNIVSERDADARNTFPLNY